MRYTEAAITAWNRELHALSPEEVVREVLARAERPVVTTNFRPYEAAILHLISRVQPEIPVIWCDTGYNTPETYQHADALIERLQLNVHIFIPQRTAAYRDARFGGLPTLEDPRHAEFTEEVKLEPFRRAMKQFAPDLWFTNLRKGQTALRDRLDILSMGQEGLLKVSPFFYFSDDELDEYLTQHGLPNEHRYFDPTKVESSRECGLHT